MICSVDIRKQRTVADRKLIMAQAPEFKCVRSLMQEAASCRLQRMSSSHSYWYLCHRTKGIKLQRQNMNCEQTEIHGFISNANGLLLLASVYMFLAAIVFLAYCVSQTVGWDPLVSPMQTFGEKVLKHKKTFARLLPSLQKKIITRNSNL